VQRLRRLSRRRAARSEEGAFVIDGPVLVREALVAGIDVWEVLVEPGEAPEVVEAAEAAGVTVVTVAPRWTWGWPWPRPRRAA
jgi:hypothetical protein